MALIQNVSDERQAVSGLEVFEPGEIREVSDWLAVRLSRNSNFRICDTVEKKEETVDEDVESDAPKRGKNAAKSNV